MFLKCEIKNKLKKGIAFLFVLNLAFNIQYTFDLINHWYKSLFKLLLIIVTFLLFSYSFAEDCKSDIQKNNSKTVVFQKEETQLTTFLGLEHELSYCSETEEKIELETEFVSNAFIIKIKKTDFRNSSKISFFSFNPNVVVQGLKIPFYDLFCNWKINLI